MRTLQPFFHVLSPGDTTELDQSDDVKGLCTVQEDVLRDTNRGLGKVVHITAAGDRI